MLLALSALVGRIVLSLLPPGPIGSHRLRDLPVTWAVSHLLGVLTIIVQGSSIERLGLPAAELLLWPWIVVGVIRWSTLPGSMVPGHAPPHEGAGRGARVVWLLSAAGAVGILLFRPTLPWTPSSAIDPEDQLIRITSYLALLILVDYALRTARRAPLARSVAFAIGVLAFPGGACPNADAAAFGAGVALLVPWIRRADRRACWISLYLFAGATLLWSIWPQVVGWGALFLVSTRTQRAYALGPALFLALFLTLPGVLFVSKDWLDDGWKGLAVPLFLLLAGLRVFPRERTAVEATT